MMMFLLRVVFEIVVGINDCCDETIIGQDCFNRRNVVWRQVGVGSRRRRLTTRGSSLASSSLN
jgi:hypothetical protein